VEPERRSQRLAPVPTLPPSAARIAGAVLILALAASSAACSAAAPELAGREFVSQTVTAPDPSLPLVVGTQVRMRFTATEVSFSAGCNSMGGGYRIEDGTRLVVGNIFTTDVGCDPERHAQDEWLSSLLGSGPSIRLVDDTLAIESGSTQILLKDREVVEPDAELVGPTWTVESIISGDAVSSVPADAVATLAFLDDGTIEVNAGCNRGSGTWTAVAGGIEVGPLMLTKMACQQQPAMLESAVLTVLEADAIAAAIDGPLLTLQAGGQGLVLRAS
jgi:heat shock protein HslJ